MNWYALHVMTGHEQEIAAKLELLGVRALVPVCTRMQRKDIRGWVEVDEVAFPGYVLLEASPAPRLYYSIRAIPAVIKFLGMTEGIPATIPHEEMDAWWYMGGDGKPFGVSEGERVDGITRIRSGPLAQLEDKIVSVDARQHRATIQLQIHGKPIKVNVGIKVKSSQSKAADEQSPRGGEGEQREATGQAELPETGRGEAIPGTPF